MILRLTACLSAVFIGASVSASGNLDKDMQRMISDDITQWLANPIVQKMVSAQNSKSALLSADRIHELDETWRSQTVSGGSLISSTLENKLSVYLKGIIEASGGVYSEIFVHDQVGLNVGQSGVTSDYWQGDEAKWQIPKTTLEPHIGQVEFDESSQSYQTQISVPIIDRAEFIGVITVGVDLEILEAAN